MKEFFTIMVIIVICVSAISYVIDLILNNVITNLEKKITMQKINDIVINRYKNYQPKQFFIDKF